MTYLNYRPQPSFTASKFWPERRRPRRCSLRPAGGSQPSNPPMQLEKLRLLSPPLRGPCHAPLATCEEGAIVVDRRQYGFQHSSAVCCKAGVLPLNFIRGAAIQHDGIGGVSDWRLRRWVVFHAWSSADWRMRCASGLARDRGRFGRGETANPDCADFKFLRA